MIRKYELEREKRELERDLSRFKNTYNPRSEYFESNYRNSNPTRTGNYNYYTPCTENGKHGMLIHDGHICAYTSCTAVCETKSCPSDRELSADQSQCCLKG